MWWWACPRFSARKGRHHINFCFLLDVELANDHCTCTGASLQVVLLFTPSSCSTHR